MKRITSRFLTGLTLGSLFLLPPTASGQAAAPAYTELPWIRTGGPIGGLGYDIRYNFAEPHLWYVTDAWAGIHMSEDNGMTWQPRTEGIDVVFGPTGDVIPIFSATVDPLSPNIIWIGTQSTGEIFKSNDAGLTWSKMDNGIDHSLLPLSFRGFTVHPHDSEIVYAMAEIGSPGWTPDGQSRTGMGMDLTQGVVYRTVDGGAHWEEVWRGDNLTRYCWINPESPDVIYVSTGIFDREAANTNVDDAFAGGVGILKSVDGGETWEVLDETNGLTDLYISSLYMHPHDPDVLLAAAGSDPWHFRDGENVSGIFLTVDGGQNWERVVADEVGLELFVAVEYCPSDPDIAYAASTNAAYRSDDSGRTWHRFDKGDNTWGPPGIVAGFPIDMQCDPRDPMRVFVNNYLGGNFLSEDGGETWVSASAGYTGAIVRHLAIAPGTPNFVYAGSRSGVFRSEDGGRSWTGLAYSPEGLSIRINEISAIAVSPVDPYRVLSAPADARTVLYSENGGITWLHAPLHGTPASPVDLVFAPSEPQTVYAAVMAPGCAMTEGADPSECEQPGAGLYVSHDGGRSWQPPDGEETLGLSISSVVVSPDDPATVYGVLPLVGVFVSHDGGVSWAQTGGDQLTSVEHALAIDANDPLHLVVAGAGGLFYTTDGGETWTRSTAGLDANGRFRSPVIDPTDGSVVYVADGTSGVFVSMDGGQSWNAINDGLDHRSAYVLSLSNDGTVLYVGIEGAGVYRLGEARSSGTATEPPPAVGNFGLVQGYPNPFGTETVIQYSLDRPADVDLRVYNLLGRGVTTLVNGPQNAGFHTVRWSGVDQRGVRVADGIYLCVLRANGRTATEALIVAK